jgi:membrane protein
MNISDRLKRVATLVHQSFSEWIQDDVPRLGAALAYYTLFSIAPLLVVVVSLAGVVFGAEATRSHLFSELPLYLGAEGSKFVESIVDARATSSELGGAAALIGLAVSFIGATAFFAQLQGALDTVWNIRHTAKQSWMDMVRSYWWSFTMILGIGFLLLVSLILSTVLDTMSSLSISRYAYVAKTLGALHAVVAYFVSWLLFACLFKYVPKVEMEWRDVWVGSFVTAALFAIGRSVLSWYISAAALTSPFGAAGALVTFLVWIYYSSQILLYGAELTQVLTKERGRIPRPVSGFEYVHFEPSRA